MDRKCKICKRELKEANTYDLSFSDTSPRQQCQQSTDLHLILLQIYLQVCGPGNSVGIATDYVLDGPGSNPGGEEIFPPSRPALGHTRPPAKLVPGLSRG